MSALSSSHTISTQFIGLADQTVTGVFSGVIHVVTAVCRIQLQELRAKILCCKAALVLLKHENLALKLKVCEHDQNCVKKTVGSETPLQQK